MRAGAVCRSFRLTISRQGEKLVIRIKQRVCIAAIGCSMKKTTVGTLWLLNFLVRRTGFEPTTTGLEKVSNPKKLYKSTT
jgi:hypothetical protein